MDLRTQATLLAGWPTPIDNDAKGSTHCHSPIKADGTRDIFLKLPGAARLAGWPTPITNDAEKRGTPSASSGGLASVTPHLAGWTTASARDWKDTPGMAGERADGKPRHDQLPRQAYLAGWPTPVAQDDNKSVEARLAMKQRMGERDGSKANRTAITSLSVMAKIAGPARLTAFGDLQIGFTAPMENGVQLSPAHSRWIMCYPAAWDRAAPNYDDYAIWQELTALAFEMQRPTEKVL